MIKEEILSYAWHLTFVNGQLSSVFHRLVISINWLVQRQHDVRCPAFISHVDLMTNKVERTFYIGAAHILRLYFTSFFLFWTEPNFIKIAKGACF